MENECSEQEGGRLQGYPGTCADPTNSAGLGPTQASLQGRYSAGGQHPFNTYPFPSPTHKTVEHRARKDTALRDSIGTSRWTAVRQRQRQSPQPHFPLLCLPAFPAPSPEKPLLHLTHNRGQQAGSLCRLQATEWPLLPILRTGWTNSRSHERRGHLEQGHRTRKNTLGHSKGYCVRSSHPV